MASYAAYGKVSVVQRLGGAAAVSTTLVLGLRPRARATTSPMRHRAGPRALQAAGTGLGMGVTAALLVAGAIAWIAGAHVLAGLIAAGATGVAVGTAVTRLAARSLVERPLEQLVSAMETLATRDIVGLADVLADLADGEKVHQLEVHARPVELPPSPTVRRLAQAANTAIQRLKGTAAQFNFSADEPCRRVAGSTYRVALSDHSDFEQLLAYVAASGARLLIADGFRAQAASVFAAEVQRRLGIRALALP